MRPQWINPIKDLEPMIGQANRVYEVLNYKRPLSLRMIRNLNKGLGISAQVLISESARV
jgi:HTH-type transcriptional regulator/antitoxin HigA